MRSSAPAEMSLSRRFLSLPQELPGASLPPQVAGQRCGTVTLCVPHILSSAVSSRPLPRVALVRVRWWGEQAPDSLFRPSLLSADGGGSSHRATAMKYPVNVQPAQLVEYFEDMRHLTLDVIDRDARKKVGECRLSLELERDNAVMTAEEKLVALRRDNALCEIKPTGAHEQDEVLGYLAVSFDVQWTDETKWRSREHEESEQVEEADRRVISVLDEKEEEVVVKKENREESGRSDDFQRIQKLLAKGKALQQSMERAVREKENGEGGEVDIVEAWLQYTNAESTLLGLSKVPLRDFAEFFRSDEVDLLGYRKQILPIASVDGKFAIENPFTGHVAGYLHVRVSMGTAEQV
ncbi:hypothetical protein PR003_g1001 [Phytophthora rubi]|uniref:C2CD3 N-terminal C2 domain-containing protein n=1 Tax=Phytophthora rubi TaxID=129364 RepID=A0A6A4G697_9STRA|nr:hypothetical protein PR003_g1001 [Phytophthora rubi]